MFPAATEVPAKRFPTAPRTLVGSPQSSTEIRDRTEGCRRQVGVNSASVIG